MQRLFPAAVLATLVLTLAVAWELRGLHAAVDALVVSKDISMQTAEASWVSGGITITVKTTRNSGESAGDFADRHKEAVDAMLAKYPKPT